MVVPIVGTCVLPALLQHSGVQLERGGCQPFVHLVQPAWGQLGAGPGKEGCGEVWAGGYGPSPFPAPGAAVRTGLDGGGVAREGTGGQGRWRPAPGRGLQRPGVGVGVRKAALPTPLPPRVCSPATGQTLTGFTVALAGRGRGDWQAWAQEPPGISTGVGAQAKFTFREDGAGRRLQLLPGQCQTRSRA